MKLCLFTSTDSIAELRGTSKPLFCPVFRTASLALIHCDLSSSQSELLTTFNPSPSEEYIDHLTVLPRMPTCHSTHPYSNFHPTFSPCLLGLFYCPRMLSLLLNLPEQWPVTCRRHNFHIRYTARSMSTSWTASLPPPFHSTWPSSTLQQPRVEWVTAIIHYSLPLTLTLEWRTMSYSWSSEGWPGWLGKRGAGALGGWRSSPFVKINEPVNCFDQEGMPPSTISPFQAPGAMYDTVGSPYRITNINPKAGRE